MALSIWTQRSGYSFGTIQERSQIDWQLPVNYASGFDDSTNLTFRVISGNLPPGLRLTNDRIVGTPFEVPRTTDFKFVIRATYGTQISDRTFFITVDGSDPPGWVTPEGALPIGANNAYYILDNAYIDFQLETLDNDTASGQKLNYFIASKEGELPPGIILTSSGRITGWVQPLLAIVPSDGTGFFDAGAYDAGAFDFGIRSSNGYDSYIFDVTNYDFSVSTNSPKKLNRNYEFIVTVTDGDTISKRKFRIFVVGDDFFRSDTTIMQVGTGAYTADVSYVRTPIWVTPANLGTRRANNYQTIRLDIYDIGTPWPISYRLETRNPDNSLSKLPPGLNFDSQTGELYGAVPYQPAITKNYRFTITAIRFSDTTETAEASRTFSINILGEVESIMSWATEPDLGQTETNLVSTLFVKANTTLIDSVVLYKLESNNPDGSLSKLPPGLSMNLDGELVGKVSQFGPDIEYQGPWSISTNPRIYNVNDVVRYNSQYYKCVVQHISQGVFLTSNWVVYDLVSELKGVTSIENGNFTLDGGDLTLDKIFKFTVTAADILGYSEITRTFTLRVLAPNDRPYSNLVVRPFLKPDQREAFRAFITSADVFDPSLIYRPNDPNFGVQRELKMLIFAGIETKSAGLVASVLGRNHKPKRFKLGEIKKAQAKIPGTNTVVYEVIYIDVIDPLEIGKSHLELTEPTSFSNLPVTVDQTNDYYKVYDVELLDTPQKHWGAPQPFDVTTDRNNLFAGDPKTLFRQPSSVYLWRKRIREIGLRDRQYLPLWMRTIQDGSVQELDYVKAIPLCYCKPGKGEDILLNIKNRDFDFNQIDYTIDRYIIDQVTGYSADKYIAFRNDRTTIT